MALLKIMFKGLLSPQIDEEGIPTQTAFSQQKIEAWRPLFTPFIVIMICISTGIVFIALGLTFYFISKSMIEIDVRYDNVCPDIGKKCYVNFAIPRDIHKNLYLHFRLTKFYQNHKRYYYSRCDEQLRGQYADYDTMSYCGDFRSHNGSKNPEDWIIPCGAIAISYFNDSFAISEKENETIVISSSGIAWRSDKEKLFKNVSSQYLNSTVWINNLTQPYENGQKNEHFMVWMRISSIPTIMKLYGKITSTMEKGDYVMEIQNNYPTSIFHGEKHFVLSTTTMLGGKNPAFGILYLATGGCLMFFGIVILIGHLFWPRKLGDASYLVPSRF